MIIAAVRNDDSIIGVIGVSDHGSLLRTLTDAISSSFSCDEIHFNMKAETMWENLRGTRRLELNIDIVHSDDTTESVNILVTLTKFYLEQETLDKKVEKTDQ